MDQMTDAQRGTIARLADEIGLDEAALDDFARRTAHVSVRALSRRQASAVITGLSKWAKMKGRDTRSKTRQAIDALLGVEP